MKIAMMTEGTYPHGFGGVSVWCDQLIRGMPGYDFHLVAIVATGAEQAVWPLPANVTSMVRVMLWGPGPARGAGGVRGGLPVRLLRGLVDTLLDASPRAQPHFADVLRDLFEYAQRGDLSTDLISDKSIRVLSEAWRDRWQGTAQSAPALHDAVTAMQLLAHCLRPLSYPSAQADVGHAVTNGLGVLPALAAKWQYGMPMLVTEHGVYLREQYLRNSKSPYRWPVKSFHLAFMRRLCTLGYSEAETITPGNVYNRRWEERLGAEPGRIRTVYNGVDPANFPAIVGEPADPTISWVGRIDPIKDLETLLRAFCIVRRDLPGAKLRLFGAPPHGRDSYLQRCRTLAAELGIAGAATFEGRIEDIRDAYGAGSIVALSSVSEGFPYSLIEAMTCGRTCVATDVGGVAEAVGDTGMVVPPRDPERMAQACLTLLRNNELRHRLGDAARARALENFTVDAAISTFDEIYSFLGSGRPLPTVPSATARTLLEQEPPALVAAGALPVGAVPVGAVPVGAVPVGAVPVGAGPARTGPRRRTTGWVTQSGTDERGAPGPGRPGAGQRGVDELCEQFVLVCESAVDPLEISSALEFDGLSDQTARDRYGVRDVFALADEMYRRVPRRPAEPEQPADPWHISKVKSALHGLLYGLPTACFPAATGLLTGRDVLTVLIVALLASWAISQTLAYLGHARMGQAEPAQAARLLLGGTAAGAAAVVLVTAMTAVTVHARVTALFFGVGLGTYMVGATVLMVLGAERLLLVVLAPAVLGAASFLIAGRPPALEHAVWSALAITPLLALALAAARARQLSRTASGQPGQIGPELRRALPSAGFGLVAAGLLVFPFATSGHGVDTGAELASLPLALSMGAAEWTLVWFRRRTQRLLRTTRELVAFAARARLALAAAVLQYLSAATVLTAAVVVTATATGLIQPHWAVLPQIATYLALGGAMFVALLLQAFGVRGLPLITCAGALILEVLWRRLGVLGQIVACAELFIVLTGYAAVTLGRVVHHAC